MADCPRRDGTEQPHCWHPMTAPYSVANPEGGLGAAIGECCCFCGAAHVKILMERPPDADNHGEHLAFQTPKPAPVTPPPPAILLPGDPRVRH